MLLTTSNNEKNTLDNLYTKLRSLKRNQRLDLLLRKNENNIKNLIQDPYQEEIENTIEQIKNLKDSKE